MIYLNSNLGVKVVIEKDKDSFILTIRRNEKYVVLGRNDSFTSSLRDMNIYLKNLENENVHS